MTYKIVCFCGGGIRGLLSATILQNLADAYPNILSKTDLFAGTSTGAGIISWLLAGTTPAGIIQKYLTSEVQFFSFEDFEPTKPGYDIDLVFAGQAAMHGLKTLNDFDQSVLFTSFNVGSATSPTEHTPWQPILYSNLTSSPNGGTTVAEAVTSSSAMPGMLGSYEGNIDGAFVNHDPTLAALASAIHYEKVSLSDIVVICIGTGLMQNWIASDTHSWGAQQWQKRRQQPAQQHPAAPGQRNDLSRVERDHERYLDQSHSRSLRHDARTELRLSESDARPVHPGERRQPRRPGVSAGAGGELRSIADGECNAVVEDVLGVITRISRRSGTSSRARRSTPRASIQWKTSSIATQAARWPSRHKVTV